MKKKTLYMMFMVVLVLSFSLVPATPAAGADSTFTFTGGSLTTTNTGSWGGYNIHNYGVHFNVDAGPLTIEYLGVNAYPINYTGDFGWPVDPTDTGASVIVGVGNGINIAQYSFKSNMSGNKPRGTDPETYGKGSWDYQNIGHWNDDGYRSYLFQGQFTDNWTATVGNSQYNAEKHGGPTGIDPDYDTFDFKFGVEYVALNTYEVTGWHNLWKSSAIDEGCYWDWNYAKNAHNPAKRGYLQCFEGTWTADGGLDLSDVQVFLAIQNWQGTQPELYTFDWDSVVVTGTVIPPDEVWVDDDWTGLDPGDPADGHTFGYDAFATIQDGIDAVAGSIVHVAAGSYGGFAVNKEVTLLGAQADIDPAGATYRGASDDSDESVITGAVTITADDVTLNGFKMTNSYVAVGYTHAHNVNISYNIFENVTATWGAIHLHGYHQADGGYIGYNTISGAIGFGIWTVGNDNVVIEYNHVLGVTGTAIECLNHVGTGIVIHGNTITNPGHKGINYWAEAGAVISNNVISGTGWEAIFTDAQATISGNQITDGASYGIRLWWGTTGAAGSTVSDNIISNIAFEGIQSDVLVTITNNDITGANTGIQLSTFASGSVIDGNNIHDNQYRGLSITSDVTDATVTNNNIANHLYCGVTVWGPGEGSGIHINYNNITGSELFYGVESMRTASSPVDAQYNWWGDKRGPSRAMGKAKGHGEVKGDRVSPNVRFAPWLREPVD